MLTILVIGLALLASLQRAAAQVETCTNAPNGASGQCLNIHQCPPVLELLQQKPLRPETIRKLQAAQCGFEGTTPKVCCPRTGGGAGGPPTFTQPQVNQPVTQPPIVPTTPGAVTERPVAVANNHPKVRLLPMDICGIEAVERIVNGKRASLGEFPWMARLGYQTRVGESYRCGGSVISKRYVLTAAHCIAHLPNSLRLNSVQLGEWDANTEPDCDFVNGYQVCMPQTQKFSIERSIPHPRYSPSSVANDVGLIRLDRDANFNVDSVKPVCLPLGNLQFKNLDNIRKLTVAGWGTTENGSSSTALLYVSVPAVPNEQCKRIYQRQATITPTQICAGGESQDSCDGDSGGPLFMVENNVGDQAEPRRVQVGIVSFGPVRCGTRGQPGVYTRVGHYMSWILENMNP